MQCINIRIPTGINQTYIDLILHDNFYHNIKYGDFRNEILEMRGNHHKLILHVTRYCIACRSIKCKCSPEREMGRRLRV